MSWPITLDDVLAAERRIRPFLPPTPLRRYPELDDATGMRLLVKHENHQPTNAFKVRNALSAVTAMSDTERSRGLIAATMGNHGQGLAWAGRALGAPVVICVPHNANAEKVAAMRALGARIVQEGDDFDDALLVMDRLVAAEGLVPVHGVNHPKVPAGAGTLALEALAQTEAMGERIDAMIFAIGGGSQAVGSMTVTRTRAPEIEVFGVQAAGAPTIHDAWRRGEPAVGQPPRTIADGMATRSTYELTFDALREGLTDFTLVDDEQIAEAMRLMIRTTHNLVEPAGAAGLAGAIRLADRLRGRTAMVVLSGSNVDQPTLRRVLAE